MAMSTCKADGCEGRVKGRGMCGTHYARWAKENPELRVMHLNDKLVLDHMPGTSGELAIETGLAFNTVLRALARLRASDRSHIVDFREPEKSGVHWEPIHGAGPGRDARLSQERKRKHRNLMNRKARARQSAEKPHAPSAVVPGWAASLVAGA